MGARTHRTGRTRSYGGRMRIRARTTTAVTAAALTLGLAACGGGMTTTVTSTSRATTTTTSAATAGIVNEWSGAPVDLTKLPLGTSHVSLTTASRGGLLACSPGATNPQGAFRAGPWIDERAGTWNATQKVAVRGKVSWPMAAYSEKVAGTTRTITSTGVPVKMITGTFPIATDDPAYAYDRNPNSIRSYPLSLSLPVTPTVASAPGCLTGGLIAIARNGVAMYAPLDEGNRDAVAYETQDTCDGHPQQASIYHYHDVPSCILAAATGSSTVIGFARDGYPIVVERDAKGELPTNADLDECHGRTAPVLLDGQVVSAYHYSATHEFPYFMGCFKGVTS